MTWTIIFKFRGVTKEILCSIMISEEIAVLGIFGATLIPVFASLLLIFFLSSFVHIRYIAAIGLGVTFWFFIDTMGDAAYLDVNSSIASFGGLPHFGVIAAFILGIIALALFDHFAVPTTRSQQYAAIRQKMTNGGTPLSLPPYYNSLFLIPAGVAAVMGIHGLGEGWDFGAAASGASATSLLDAFGGIYPLISYPLHKFFEAAIIAAAYSAYVARPKPGLSSTTLLWQIPVLGLLFGLPSVIGSAVGYSVSFDTTYFFAFGVTSALYAVIRLVEPLSLKFRVGDNSPAYLGGRVFLVVAIGFFLLYTAALFH
jgi:hypothetical protein